MFLENHAGASLPFHGYVILENQEVKKLRFVGIFCRLLKSVSVSCFHYRSSVTLKLSFSKNIQRAILVTLLILLTLGIFLPR